MGKKKVIPEYFMKYNNIKSLQFGQTLYEYEPYEIHGNTLYLNKFIYFKSKNF
jgi:hypothetical protein